MSVREPHNNLVSATIYGRLKEERYEDDNIIISDSTLHSLFPPQFKNVIKIKGHVWLQILHICQSYAFVITVMARSYLKNSRISARMLKSEGMGKKKICIYETYKNTVMPLGRHIYATPK